MSRATALGLTDLQEKVLAYHSRHARGYGDAGWNTSARALLRRRMLRRDQAGLHITELGLKALRARNGGEV